MQGARDRDARRVAQRTARAAYGRLIAVLARRTRDIAAAEDALAEAFVRALETWPARGVPDAPEAWLLTVARRTATDRERHAHVRESAQEAVKRIYEELGTIEPTTLPDERLRLLFACAHPAIDESIRTPLMLQTILGLDAARIAEAFLVSPSTMGQRLVRAKRKIRDAGLRIDAPPPTQLPARLQEVLNAIYVAYGADWSEATPIELGGGLAEEALFLAELVTALLPDEPEPMGLLSLMLYCQARRAARRSPTGAFVPLSEQDPRAWSRDQLIRAEWWLTRAARFGRGGRFQTEAAIQSFHCQRTLTGRDDAAALAKLYDLLCTQTDAIGAWIGRAIAHGAWRGPDAGLEILEQLPAVRVNAHQPYWVARAHLRRQAGLPDDASLERALELTADPAVRAWLEAQLECRGANFDPHT